MWGLFLSRLYILFFEWSHPPPALLNIILIIYQLKIAASSKSNSGFCTKPKPTISGVIITNAPGRAISTMI